MDAQILSNLNELEEYASNAMYFRIRDDSARCDELERSINILFKNMFDADDPGLNYAVRSRDKRLLQEREYDVGVRLALTAMAESIGYICFDYVRDARYLLETLRFRSARELQIQNVKRWTKDGASEYVMLLPKNC